MSDAVSEYETSDMAPAPQPQDDAETSSTVVETNTVPATTVANPESDVTTTADAVADNVPVAQTMRARAAVLEAILDQVVEDAKDPEDPSEEPMTREEATEVVSDVVDKAVDADVVSPSFRRRIPAIINRNYKRSDRMAQLYAKAARYTAAVLTEVKEDAIELDPVVDDACKKGEGICDVEKGEGELTFTNNAKVASGPGMFVPGVGYMSTIPASEDEISIEPVAEDQATGKEDIGENIDDTTLEYGGFNPTSEGGPSMRRRSKMSARTRWSMEDDPDGFKDESDAKAETEDEATKEVADAAVDPEADVSVDNVENKPVADTMRFLTAATINQHKFTTYVSRNYTSALVRKMMHELRFCLPANFVRKYRIK